MTTRDSSTAPLPWVAAAAASVTPEQLAQARRRLGQQLAEHREAAGLTQAHLARLTGYTRSAIANVETGRSSQPRTSWTRYDQLLHAGGVLLAGHDHYATLTAQYRQQAAQERERQRTARVEQWRQGMITPTGPGDLGAGPGSHLDRTPPAVIRDAEPAGPVVTATIVPDATGREVDATNRRQALTTALGLTGAAVVDTSEPRTLGGSVLSLAGLLPPDPDELEPGQGDGIAAYGELSQHLWRLYWSASAGPLFEAAYAQVRLGVDLLGDVSGRDRLRVSSALALSALLTARLAFFDLSRPGAAARCHQVALTAASEAGDHTMVAVVLGHMAFGPAFAREPERARELTAMALPSAQSAGSLVCSWLHCVASEAESRAGNGPASQRSIDLAEAASAADEPAPEWFDFYDPARLDCFAGYAALAADDLALATDRLTRGVVGLGQRGFKQRSVVYADLAAACQGDADQAAHHLHEAIDALEANWYGIGWDRVHQTRTALGDSQLGRQIDQRLSTLPGGRD
jgi:transcriptional regulator with XRE-family HTH domain